MTAAEIASGIADAFGDGDPVTQKRVRQRIRDLLKAGRIDRPDGGSGAFSQDAIMRWIVKYFPALATHLSFDDARNVVVPASGAVVEANDVCVGVGAVSAPYQAFPEDLVGCKRLIVEQRELILAQQHELNELRAIKLDYDRIIAAKQAYRQQQSERSKGKRKTKI
jgi:hypothetical protein